MTPAQELSIQEQLALLVKAPNARPVNVAGEMFGYLRARLPIGHAPNPNTDSLVWRFDCTKCGAGTRDTTLSYARAQVRRAKTKGRECMLACESCTLRGRPTRPPEERGKRKVTKVAKAPSRPVKAAAKSKTPTSPPKQQKWATPQEKARSRRSSRFDPEPIRVPTGDLELVVDGKVMARGSREDDWGRLQRTLGGEVRPVMRRAPSPKEQRLGTD